MINKKFGDLFFYNLTHLNFDFKYDNVKPINNEDIPIVMHGFNFGANYSNFRFGVSVNIANTLSSKVSEIEAPLR